MKRILLFGAGKSSTCLIDYLIRESALQEWKLTVADGNLGLAQSKIGNASHAKATGVEIENEKERGALIKNADLVISLLPPALHASVAQDCLKFEKNLLTASYVDEKIRRLDTAIKDKKLLFLCEMGLDPGIDHMSAIELIHRIRSLGGRIISFKSHTGGLVAPESDDNPWHYKISWNPRNIVTAGSAGAVYLENSCIIKIPYRSLFGHCAKVSIPGLAKLAYYPNRDSLDYISLYQLQEAHTFIRTTLRHPDFCSGWKCLVEAGLTDDKTKLAGKGLTLKEWSQPITPYLNSENKPLFKYLGMFDEDPLLSTNKTSADVLQEILERKLPMRTQDKDMIVMFHEIEYETSERNEKGRYLRSKLESFMIVKGEDGLRTAMAKTVGLPLGISAKLILEKKITLTGLHIPILPEIYQPVLQELEKQGIAFEEKIS